MLMLAVGIDVSKSKSAAAILNPDGTVHTKPFEFRHSQPEMDALIRYIKDQNQPVTILMENTGHYHYPVLKALEAAGLPVRLFPGSSYLNGSEIRGSPFPRKAV